MEPSAALDSHFGVAHQTELNQMCLKPRTHCREESLAEPVEDFKLVGGIPTEGKNLCIHRKKPATLRYFQVPLQIHILQGQNPESALFAEKTPCHPQFNGMVAVLSRLVVVLSKLVDYNQDWDWHIQILLMAALHETTGCFPAKLLFDRDVTVPIDLAIGRPAAAPDSGRVCQHPEDHDRSNDVRIITWVSPVAAQGCCMVIQPSAEGGPHSQAMVSMARDLFCHIKVNQWLSLQDQAGTNNKTQGSP